MSPAANPFPPGMSVEEKCFIVYTQALDILVKMFCINPTYIQMVSPNELYSNTL
jgi:hypothetical protein